MALRLLAECRHIGGMANDDPAGPTKPLTAKHFVNVLEHLEELLEADIIAWDARSSAQAQRRLDRLTAALMRISHKIGEAL